MKKRLEQLIKLGVFAAISMYLINKLIESWLTIRNFAKKSDDCWFHWTHGTAYYEKTGKGTPLLLIHDLHPSSSMKEWNEVREELSKTHTVYAVDLPGCGRSEKSEITYVNYYYTKFVSEFIETIIKEKTDIIATGLSGSFVLMTARLCPDLIGRISLVNPKSPEQMAKTPDTKGKLIHTALSIPILGVFLYYVMTARTQIDYDFTEKYFCNPFRIRSKWIDIWYESAHIQQGNGRFLMGSLLGNYIGVDIKIPCTSLKNELQLIYGKEQPHASTDLRHWQILYPNAKGCFVKNTKMLPQMENPEQFLSVIKHKMIQASQGQSPRRART